MKSLQVYIVVLFRLCQGSIFTEGDEARIDFQCDVTDFDNFKLRLGARVPFYNNGEFVTSELNESQLKRYHVSKDTLEHNVVIISFIIKPVLREDAGTVVCDVYRDGEITEEKRKISKLAVAFPPSNASCEFEPNQQQYKHPEDPWVVLICSAHLGNHLSYISCYQNGELAPKYENIKINITHMLQRWHVRTTLPVFCCSSTHRHPLHQKNCTHFIWPHGIDTEDLTSAAPSTHTDKLATTPYGRPSFPSEEKMEKGSDDSYRDNLIGVIMFGVTWLAVMLHVVCILPWQIYKK